MRRLLAVAFALSMMPAAAFAQAVTNDGVDQVLTRLHTQSMNWVAPLEAIAMGTFGILAVINLVYFVPYRLILSGDFDIRSFIAAVVQEVFYISFFFWLLTSFATTTPLIIKGFQVAAGRAGGLPITPNAIFNTGVDIADKIGQQASIWAPGDAIVMLLCGLIIQGCFCVIVLGMVYVIAESYFVTTAGQILLMFGALRFTSDIPVNLLRTCVGIGLKLFALQLIASFGTGLIQEWVNQYVANNVSFQGILVQIGETVMLAALTISVPHMFERMVSHVGTGGAGNMIGAAATIGTAGTLIGRAVTKAIEGASGRIASAISAGRLASTQMSARDAAGTSPQSASGRAAMMIGSTMGNMAAAKTDDVVRGLRGTRTPAGVPGWRQAAANDERRRLMQEGLNAPPPPAQQQGNNP